MTEKINVLELFAGVGGFRVGLENSNSELFHTKWSNQWEPSRSSQDAFEVYNYKFPESININKNIEDITDDEFSKIDADLIVGGFPCQDYSVARSKKDEMGIEGKKGVLFWQIIRATSIIKPKYLILENVDRLLKSPSSQRGRDFAVMLAAFNQLDYSVEWRVINAADYGRSQRRRRVFFFIYRNDTSFAKKMDEQFLDQDISLLSDSHKYDEYIYKEGLFARQFPIEAKANKKRYASYYLSDDIVTVSNEFSGKVWNTGIMRHGHYYTIDTLPTNNEEPSPLKNIIQPEEDVESNFYLNDSKKLEKFKYLRGPKNIERTTKDGHNYIFSEGSMSPYDDLELPGRTMLTSEGSVNRSTHLLFINSKFRLITPIEAERLQDFPDNWTKYKIDSNNEVLEVPNRRRMFFMGNALVTEIVKRIGDELQIII